MTWIAPQTHTYSSVSPPKDRARILIIIINCLRELGEPSTVAELAAYARARTPSRGVERLEQDIAEVLAQYSQEPTDPTELAPFHCTERGEVKAWTFSPAFRRALADSGIELPGRPPEAM